MGNEGVRKDQPVMAACGGVTGKGVDLGFHQSKLPKSPFLPFSFFTLTIFSFQLPILGRAKSSNGC